MSRISPGLGRLFLLSSGLAIGAGIFAVVENRYLRHEQQLISRPVFDPPGIKYAYSSALEVGKIRGWVAGMQPPPRRPGTARIIALGDSVTYGLGTRAEDAWPAALERQVGDVVDVEVFNLAMCGWDAEQSVSLAIHELPRWQPDLVVWATYTNDVLPTYLMWAATDEHPVFVGTSIPESVGVLPEAADLWLARRSAIYRLFLANRMARAKKAGLQLGPRVDWYERQLSELAQWSKTTDTPVLVLALPAHTQADPAQCPAVVNEHDCRLQAEGYRTITQTLSRSGLDWIDGQAIYAATGRPHFMIQPGAAAGPGAWDNDAEHPTAAGHAALAAGITTEVVRRLHR
jgi:hypothetical protein